MSVVKNLLLNTLNKLDSERALWNEFQELEQVPPAPGRPGDQHDQMVAQGLCKQAEKYPKNNRYCNQYPFDSHIVKVRDLDYINASWMSLDELPDSKFIITMGPLHPEDFGSRRQSDFGSNSVPNTCGHFWRMCWGHDIKVENSVPNTCADFWQMSWTHDVKVITMMCKLAPGYQGCSKYFPTEDGEIRDIDGKFSISLEGPVDNRDGFAIRNLVVLNKETKETKKVRHHQFLLWPNYGIPEDIKELTQFVKAVEASTEELCKDQEFKMVLHCSGGLGRSGTFLTIFTAYKMIQNSLIRNQPIPKKYFGNETINLMPAVKVFRTQRHPWMVESMAQYYLAYETVVELLKEMK